MLDLKLKTKKNIEYKKHLRLVGVLKQSVGVTIITKQILD